MESELFGHKRGSFTGAVGDKKGLIQSAEGGTLFLDEIADLPLHMQVKLLRVIQEKAVRPVGEQHGGRRSTCACLSATHKNLAQLVAEGKFREDLFYRVNVIELRVPSLRERPEDVPELAEAVLRRLGRRMKITPPMLGKDALSALEALRLSGQCTRTREYSRSAPITLSTGGEMRAGDIQLRPPPSEACSPQRRHAGRRRPRRPPRGHRARRHHQGAGADALQQDGRRQGSGDVVSGAALPDQETRHRMKSVIHLMLTINSCGKIE